jgi:hypothetical protein
VQHQKTCNATSKKYVLQHRKIMYCNIENYVLQHRKKLCSATSKKHVPQHQKLCATISKIMYYNISNSSTATSQKHLLQRPKNPIATSKNLLQHGRKQQKCMNNKRDGFEAQAAPAPGPITFEFAGGRSE